MTGASLSPRLRAIVDALPIRPGLRVLEVGGAPGAAAREVTRRVGPSGYVLVVDRSAAGVEKTAESCASEIAAGVLGVRRSAIEDFTLAPGEAPYDLAFAARVGALDGRHPALFQLALARLRAALAPSGRLFVDGGHPLIEIPLDAAVPPRFDR